MFTCDQCKKRSSGPSHRTVTGRTLCDDCSNRLLGAAAGVLGAGTGAPVATKVTSALLTSGIFARLRRRHRAKGPVDEPTGQLGDQVAKSPATVTE